MLYHVSYLSRSVIPAVEENSALEAIKCQAMAHNEKTNIFGCLMYRNGWFLQYLEGKKEAICSLYEAIKRDKRHTDVKTLSRGFHPHKLCDNWHYFQVFSKPAETEQVVEVIKEFSHSMHDTQNTSESINSALLSMFQRQVQNSVTRA